VGRNNNQQPNSQQQQLRSAPDAYRRNSNNPDTDPDPDTKGHKARFYHEQAAAEKLGLSKETLRHWRVGYTVTSKGTRYTYPPKMKDGEGTTWKKEYPAKFSPILWDADFIDTLASALHTQRIAMGDLKQ